MSVARRAVAGGRRRCRRNRGRAVWPSFEIRVRNAIKMIQLERVRETAKCFPTRRFHPRRHEIQFNDFDAIAVMYTPKTKPKPKKYPS